MPGAIRHRCTALLAPLRVFVAPFPVNMDRRKRIEPYRSKSDRARKILDTEPGQETVLELVIAEAPILRVHRKLKAVGGFEDAFGEPGATGRRSREAWQGPRLS